MQANTYYNAGWKYITTGAASQYTQSSGIHSWYNAASGTAGNAISFTQAMTLDASGNLGVGQTSPSTWLVNGIGIGSGTSDWGATIYTGTSSSGYLCFADGTSTTDRYRGYIQYTHASDAMVFATAATERARINANGRFEVSYSTNTGSQAAIFTNSAATVGNQYGLGVTLSSDPNGASNYFLQCLGNATERLTIRSNGGIANYSANNSNLSDRREKTNFAPAGSYLDKICAIPVQTFNYIDQNLEEDGGLTLGVVAQDVEAVAPELVMESNWGTQEEPKMRLSIYQTDLQYALMKCIQEQQAIIESLKARLDAANL
jgi:hypothetical protein